jgi:hypothetical protein
MSWRRIGECRYSSVILDLFTRWMWVVSCTPRPLYTSENSPRYHWIAGCVGPRASLDAVEKRDNSCLCRGLNPGRSPSIYGLSHPVYRNLQQTIISVTDIFETFHEVKCVWLTNKVVLEYSCEDGETGYLSQFSDCYMLDTSIFTFTFTHRKPTSRERKRKNDRKKGRNRELEKERKTP